MKPNKEKAFNLRKEGKSYHEIEKALGISRSTLSGWFKEVNWSENLMKKNIRRTWEPDHIKMMQEKRMLKLKNLYDDTELEAEREYEEYKGDPLFWAGLMIYAGEGDKRTKHLVRVSNSEFYIHKIFIKFAEKYLERGRETIKIGLIIYPDHNDSLCREMWSNLLGINRENFYKTQVIQGKERLRRLQYGVGMSIITSTVLKKKVLKWLSLAQDERFNS